MACWYISQYAMDLLHIENLIMHVPVWIGAIVFFLAGKMLSRKAIKKRKEHDVIKKNGRKYNGKVEKINVKSNLENTQFSYTLDVSYYSDIQGKTFVFTTPVVTFSPKDGDYITCNVYEYEGKVVADSFQGYTKITVWDRIKSGILVILIIAVMFGVYYLIIPFWE